MFKKGDKVTIHLGGDSRPAVVMADTNGETTKVEITYKDVLSKRPDKIVISFNNKQIEK